MKKVTKRHKQFDGVIVEQDKRTIKGFIQAVKDKVTGFFKKHWKGLALVSGTTTLALTASIATANKTHEEPEIDNNVKTESEMKRQDWRSEIHVNNMINNFVGNQIIGNQIVIGKEINLKDKEFVKTLSEESLKLYSDAEFSTNKPIGSIENLVSSERNLRVGKLKEIRDNKVLNIENNDIAALIKENPNADIRVLLQHYTIDGKIEDAGWTSHDKVKGIMKQQKEFEKQKQAENAGMER